MDNTPNPPRPTSQAGRLLKALEDRRGGGLCARDILTNFDTGLKLGISHRYADAKLQLIERGYNITTTQCPLLEYRHGHALNLAFYTLEPTDPDRLF